MKKEVVLVFLALSNLIIAYPTKISVLQTDKHLPSKIYFFHDHHTLKPKEVKPKVKKATDALIKELQEKLKYKKDLSILFERSQKEIDKYQKQSKYLGKSIYSAGYIEEQALACCQYKDATIIACDTFRTGFEKLNHLFDEFISNKELTNETLAHDLIKEFDQLLDHKANNHPFTQLLSKLTTKDPKTKAYLDSAWNRCKEALIKWYKNDFQKIISGINQKSLTKSLLESYTWKSTDAVSSFVHSLCDLEILTRLLSLKNQEAALFVGGDHAQSVSKHLLAMKHLGFRELYQTQ